jgi:hypothetical protein
VGEKEHHDDEINTWKHLGVKETPAEGARKKQVQNKLKKARILRAPSPNVCGSAAPLFLYRTNTCLAVLAVIVVVRMQHVHPAAHMCGPQCLQHVSMCRAQPSKFPMCSVQHRSSPVRRVTRLHVQHASTNVCQLTKMDDKATFTIFGGASLCKISANPDNRAEVTGSEHGVTMCCRFHQNAYSFAASVIVTTKIMKEPARGIHPATSTAGD